MGPARIHCKRMRIDIDSVKRTGDRLQLLDGNCSGKVINREIERHDCLNDSDSRYRFVFNFFRWKGLVE